ncbi:MAG: hypothetical protein ACYDBQ_10480 [Thermoplasmatota archaeon]
MAIGLAVAALVLAAPVQAQERYDPSVTPLIHPGDFHWSYLKIVRSHHFVGYDLSNVTARNGDIVTFSSLARNKGAHPTPPFLTYLSILDKNNTPVDIQNWARFRSQVASSMPPGGYAFQDWTLRMASSGSYVLYVFGLAYGQDLNATDAQPYASSALYVHVSDRPLLAAFSAAPLLVGLPLAIGVVALWMPRRRGVRA